MCSCVGQGVQDFEETQLYRHGCKQPLHVSGLQSRKKALYTFFNSSVPVENQKWCVVVSTHCIRCMVMLVKELPAWRRWIIVKASTDKRSSIPISRREEPNAGEM